MTERQQADAEVIYGLAAALDAVRQSGKGLSSVAANSRALAALSKEFRDRAGVALPPVVVDAPPAPSTRDSADEVAARRAQRRQGGRTA